MVANFYEAQLRSELGKAIPVEIQVEIMMLASRGWLAPSALNVKVKKFNQARVNSMSKCLVI